MDDLRRVKDLAEQHGKELVVYLSMAFGNPYDEAYNIDLVGERMLQAVQCGADLLSISDTTGQGNLESIAALCQFMQRESPVPWGAHLHSTYEEAGTKALVAVNNGCTRIDTALKGFGGCPFASDSLVGNMPTEKVLSALDSKGIPHSINMLALERAYNSALDVFGI